MEREKSWLKTTFKKLRLWHPVHHFMANRWGNNKNSDRLIFLGSKITVDSDCSHEIKTCLLLGRKYDKPRQYYKKQKHHFAHKVPSSQSYGFSSSHVWIESWIMKKAEHCIIDAFKLWYWRRL